MGLSKSTRSELTSSLCRVNAPTIYPADTIVNASKTLSDPSVQLLRQNINPKSMVIKKLERHKTSCSNPTTYIMQNHSSNKRSLIEVFRKKLLIEFFKNQYVYHRLLWQQRK